MTRSFAAVILAAGQGTRMKSALPKVLHPLCGVPMVAHVVNAAKAAFRDAGVTADDIGHVNAFGLGTIRCDAEEAAAIHDLFGTRAEQIPVTAFKSQLGNSGAGSGPLELAASLLGLRAGVVYPTLNYRTPDPACRLNIIHGAPAPISNKLFLKHSTTDLGQATALIAAGV